MVVYICKKCGALMEPVIDSKRGDTLYTFWTCQDCGREVEGLERFEKI